MARRGRGGVPEVVGPERAPESKGIRIELRISREGLTQTVEAQSNVLIAPTAEEMEE